MPGVTIRPLYPRPGHPLTLTIPAVVAGDCSYCGELGRLRCSVCHAWYCSQLCQANHWALHRGECVQPPHLVWADGVRYMGEVVVMDEGEQVVLDKTKGNADEEELGDQEMMSMNTLVNLGVSRAKLEQTRQQNKNKAGEDKFRTGGQEARVTKPVVREDDIKPATDKKTGEGSKPVQVSQANTRQSSRQVPSAVGQSVQQTITAELAGQVSSNNQPPPTEDRTGTVNAPSASPALSLTTTSIPAILSSTLPPQCPPPHLSQVVLPLDRDSCPRQFGVRLLDEDNQLKMLMKKMLDSPPPVVQDWKIGRRETVAMMMESVWYRAVAVRKLEEKVEVYLVDYGGLVTVDEVMLRPLPAKFAVLPAFTYQVCLAGEGEEVMKGVFKNSQEYKLGVEFVEEVPGGRWAVKLGEIKDEGDAGQLLLGSDVAVDDDAAKTEETDTCSTEEPAGQTLHHPDPMTSLPVPTQVPPVAVSVSRGVLPTGSDVVAVVCHLDTPSTLYICPIASVDQFTNILTLSQDCPPGQVVPAVGSCCLAQEEDCWYRAEIVELCQDQGLAMVFLLDYGKTVQATLSMLRQLPEVLVPVDGLVCKVSLKGIKAAGKEWSKDEIDGAGIILDTGNDATQFNVKVVEVTIMGEVVVTMSDMENNDVASLMIQTGIARLDEQSLDTDSGLQGYRPGTLSQGVHTVIMLRMVSPMELYVCSQEMFMQLSTSITMLEEAASKAAHVGSVNIGDPVIACDDGTWYRAMVTKVAGENMVQVDLVDLATQSKLPLDQIRQSSQEIIKDEVMAVSCCLNSWVGEDRKVAKEKWEHKMTSLVDEYDELEVEVVGLEEGQCRVIIPELEKKLKGESKSVADLLKERLGKK